MSSICCLCLLSKQDKDPQADVYYENEEQNEETLHEEVEDVISVKTQDEILKESSTYGVQYSMIQKSLLRCQKKLQMKQPQDMSSETWSRPTKSYQQQKCHGLICLLLRMLMMRMEPLFMEKRMLLSRIHGDTNSRTRQNQS
jgi:hypothetical protein